MSRTFLLKSLAGLDARAGPCARLDEPDDAGPVASPGDQQGGVAGLSRRLSEPPLLAAGADRRRQLQQARGRLALQDRQPRQPARIQVGGHAADGRRRRLHDGRDAAGGGGARRRDRRAALGARRAGRRARRRRAAAAVGTRRLVLDRREGRTDSLRHAGLPAGGA